MSIVAYIHSNTVPSLLTSLWEEAEVHQLDLIIVSSCSGLYLVIRNCFLSYLKCLNNRLIYTYLCDSLHMGIHNFSLFYGCVKEVL